MAGEAEDLNLGQDEQLFQCCSGGYRNLAAQSAAGERNIDGKEVYKA